MGIDNRVLICRLQESVDGQIVATFFEKGKEIQDYVMNNGEYIEYGLSGSRYLVAQKECRKPDKHHGSFFNCFTACSKFVLLQKFGLTSLESPELCLMDGLAQIDGVTVRNSLAEAHGIPPTTDLYYIYNICMPDMCKLAFAKTFALLLWREVNKETIFGRATSDIKSPLDHEWEMAIAHKNILYMARSLNRHATVGSFVRDNQEKLWPTLHYLNGLEITSTKMTQSLLERTLSNYFSLNIGSLFAKLRILEAEKKNSPL